LGRLGQLDQESWEILVELIPQLLDYEAREALLGAITRDPGGRVMVSEAIGRRLLDRIRDAREAAKGYAALLNDPKATETALQTYIEGSPWLVGLDYLRVRPRVTIPRGQLDFILERFDGFLDLLELKSPTDEIISAGSQPLVGIPPSASNFALSRQLANALAQVHVYRDQLTTDTDLMERLYGLRNSRNPRVIIVIGKMASLSPEKARVVEQLNLSLNRVEIVPYDVLGRRAEAWLSIVESYL
jgi:hypothetical protein